ncbi:MAG: Ribosomal RNA small subunit methyltransferase D [Chloroflexi bacterium ADurb.Bin180]|nr:MAG: Ribosomal RNA small subunit methyltransferase D [Chloroflexi bacterium ADurb.Bin180]
MMRVVTGQAKGRRLYAVPGDSTRPVTDRVKVSLFNILGDSVAEARFLDLFAGTGGIGIEALSRGAALAVFVERNERALATIRRNLELTRLGSVAQVVRRDVFRFLESYQGEAFDIVYVAPPQYKGLWRRTLQLLDGSSVVAEGGLVVAQIHPREYEAVDLSQLELSDQRKYGSTMLCFYEARPPGPQSVTATPGRAVSSGSQPSADPRSPQSDCSAARPAT